jgi:hypothetical protein
LRRKLLIYAGTAVIFVLLAAVGSLAAFYSPLFSHYIESHRFRTAMEEETAKGLHFPGSRYAPIRRTGLLTAESESFTARDGKKALKSLTAHDITARFNPLGVFLRQWRFSDVHVGSGEAEIQIYEVKPEGVAPKPWFAIFLPNRVFLKRIESECSNVTWRFRGEQAGFFGTRLLITPHGPDFEYVATGGTLKMPLIPDLYLGSGHILITKTLLTIYNLGLASDERSDAVIRGQGTGGIGKNKSVDFKATFDRMPIRPWLPVKWKEHLSGSALGDIHWVGENPKLESSSGEGSMRVHDARIDNFPLLEKLAELAHEKSFEHLELNECSFSFAWRYPKIDVNDIAIEEKGKLRIEGAISVDHRSLGGTIELGLAHQYLDWLPNPEEVFNRQRSGYLWTTVHLSGTIDEPKQDLSTRIIELFKESPGAYLGLLFRQFEAWLKKAFGGD